VQEEIHISSLVVHADPNYIVQIKNKINEYPSAEIFAEDPSGKLVVVLETTSSDNITEVIDTVGKLPHVLNTALVYHQIETTSNETLKESAKS